MNSFFLFCYYYYCYYYYGRRHCNSIVLNKAQLLAYWPKQLYFLKKQKKNNKATNEMYINKVTKNDDHSLRLKSIFVQSKQTTKNGLIYLELIFVN